jgi:hypothetical protein
MLAKQVSIIKVSTGLLFVLLKPFGPQLTLSRKDVSQEWKCTQTVVPESFLAPAMASIRNSDRTAPISQRRAKVNFLICLYYSRYIFRTSIAYAIEHEVDFPSRNQPSIASSVTITNGLVLDTEEEESRAIEGVVAQWLEARQDRASAN